MPAQSEELVSVLRSVIDQVASQVAQQMISDARRFRSYQGLTYEQGLARAYPPIQAIIASVETGTFTPVMTLLDQILEARLRTGYEPNDLLRMIDLFAEELIVACEMARSDDTIFTAMARRRLTFINNHIKLHLANLNLSIPLNERTEIDPVLLKQKPISS
jgi:hypothetical protein